jgi:predicted 3-demethylubiquinone-9 3-methyltransferase (glyoxalase superfamily)
MKNNQRIIPCLAFLNSAEDAMNFYLSVFPNSKVLTSSRVSAGMPFPEGTLLAATFELNGNPIMVLNGPNFAFNEALSLMVPCETQEEIDYYWEKLSADGGSTSVCGWLKDKFGVSWQVAPTQISTWLSDKNPKKTGAVMEVVMKSTKLNIADMEAAYNAG